MKHSYKRLGKLFTTYLFGNIAQNALSILLIPLYTSILSPVDFAVLALMGITVTLMTRAISSPIGHALNRFYYKPEYKSQNGLLLFNLFLLLSIEITLLSIVFWFLSPIISSLVLSDKESLLVVQLYTCVLFLTPISAFLTSLIRLKEMAGFYVLISIAQLIISTSFIIYGLLVLKIGIFAPIIGTIAGLSLMVILALPIFLRHAKFEPSISILKEPLKYGYPMVITGYSNLMLQSGDRYVLRVFDSLHSIGLYSFGYKIASLVNVMLVDPLKQSLLPVVLKLEKAPGDQKRFLTATATHYYLVSVFLALGLSLFAREVIMLIARKPEFWSAWVIVPIISFSYAQHGLGSFLGWGLVMKSKSYHISKNLLISAAINIGLNFVFIPLWGIIGAAFATLISYIAWNGLKIYYSAKFYDLHFDLWRLGHITAVGLGLYLVSSAIVNTGSMPLDLGIKFLILLSYPLFFMITGFFRDNELDYMRQLWGSVRKNGIRETYARIRAM